MICSADLSRRRLKRSHTGNCLHYIIHCKEKIIKNQFMQVKKNHPELCIILPIPSDDTRKTALIRHFLKIISCQQKHPQSTCLHLHLSRSWHNHVHWKKKIPWKVGVMFELKYIEHTLRLCINSENRTCNGNGKIYARKNTCVKYIWNYKTKFIFIRQLPVWYL